MALALAVSAAAPPASAQREDLARAFAARALFEQGLAFLDAQQWALAADRFERARALRPSPQITYNLTTALIPLGRLVSASELLSRLSRDPEAPAEVREAAELRRRQLAPRLATLLITRGPGLDDAALRLDGRPLDEALIGVPFPVDPGVHTVSALRGDREVAFSTVDLGEGAAGSTRLERPGGRDRARGRGRWVARQWWFWTILGTVVAGGAITAGVLVGTQDDR